MRAANCSPSRVVAMALAGLVRLYQLVARPFAVQPRCRFYPSCSEYAERAIAQVGAVRGTGLAVWRVVRCSPLTVGGVDHPPSRPVPYDGNILTRAWSSREAPRATGAPTGRPS